MESPGLQQNVDDILLALLQTNEAEIPAVLDKILAEKAEPVIGKIIRYRMINPVTPQSDIEDVHGEVLLRLLTRLHDFLINPDGRAIADFTKYVAVVTHNACNDYFREKFPERSLLKNRVRYLLGHHPAFAIWQSADQEWLCGFTPWQDRKTPVRTEKFHQLLHHPASLKSSGSPKCDLAKVVQEIFLHLESPVLLDDLVDISSAALGIQERITTQDAPLVESLPGPQAKEESLEYRKDYLAHLWMQIAELPVAQSKALLLNLTDDAGVNLLRLFPETGVASIREIAAVLKMSDIDLARLWPDLPIEDAKIAGFLNLSRQQVINLRKSARERLSRRMKIFEDQKRHHSE